MFDLLIKEGTIVDGTGNQDINQTLNSWRQKFYLLVTQMIKNQKKQ